MILSAEGWEVVYEYKDKDGVSRTLEESIDFFVYNEESGEVEAYRNGGDAIEPVRQSRNFSHIKGSHERTIAAQPGWYVVGKNHDDTKWIAAVVAWVIKDQGWTVLAITTTGSDEPLDRDSKDVITFVYNPEYRDVDDLALMDKAIKSQAGT